MDRMSVPGDLIDTHFDYTEVIDVIMIETRTEYDIYLKYFD